MRSSVDIFLLLTKWFLLHSLTTYTEVNTLCTEDIDCDTEGSICVESTCVCPAGYVANSDKTTCLQVSTGYGGNCEDNVQCSAILQTGGQCINGNCQCATGFHYLRGQCIRSTGLGEHCRNDDHCFINYNFESTSCKNGTCQCTDGYYQREYSDCRKISYAPGDPCGIAQDCHFKDAVCTMARVCDYKNTTQPTPPSIAESFYEEENYLNHKSTNLNTQKFNVNESYNVKVGENCLTTEDCSSVLHSYCSSTKKCLCMPGYYSSDDQDACYPELGSPCESNESCKGRYTMCRNSIKWCACQMGFVANPDNRFCLKMSRFIGWSCLHDEQCSFFGMGGICVNKKCTCTKTTHFDRSHLFCWRSQKIGDTCLNKEDCWGQGEECKGGKCTCSHGYHVARNNSECRKNALLPGDTCVDTTDCMFNHSICQNFTCTCTNGYFNASRKCVPGVGGMCAKDHDCRAKNSKCTKNICQCLNNHVPSNDNSTCLQVAKTYGDKCVETIQCSKSLGNNAVCEGSSCKCVKNSHFALENLDDQLSGHCYLNIRLGESCTKAAECIEMDKNNITMNSTRIVCRKGICNCQFRYFYDESNNNCTGIANMCSITNFLLIITLTCVILVEKFTTIK